MSSATLTELDARYRAACEVASAAGSRAMSWYQQRHQWVAEQNRALQDLVYEAESNVEQLITYLINERFPQDDVFSKMQCDSGSQARFVWVIEPINGTSSFLNGTHNWCVTLALLCDDKPVIGVVCDPNHQETFHACRGKGAWVNQRPLRVHSAGQLTQGVLGLGSSATAQPAAPLLEFIGALLQQGGMFMRSDSGALMCAWSAAGRLIGYYEPCMQPQASLPGIVLMQEAGGQTNYDHQPLQLTQGKPLLLATPAVYPSLNALLAEPLL